MATIKNTIKNTNKHITVDMFYEKQKDLYDICGNVINKDKYPFVDILSKYLTDIVGLIDVEIKNSARNSMINWREKKNPKLLSRLINSDENVNLINMSMNKITAGNYMNIVNEISDALLNDNYRKLPDYCSFLFDVVIKKCMIDEAFAKDYIRFLFGFKDNIAKHLNENISKFISESVSFLTTNQAIKEYGYFHYVKDITTWRNVGVIFSNIYKFASSSTPTNKGLPNIDIVDNLETQFDILFNILDWLPANMDELNGRLFMIFAIMENIMNNVWFKFSNKSRELFSEILKLVYNCANIPNKIKFKVLDLQDMIKNIKVPTVVSTGVDTTTPISISASTPIVIVEKVDINTSSKVPEGNNLEAKRELVSDSVNANVVANPVNIWQARKQQQVVINPTQNQNISETQPITLSSVLPAPISSLNKTSSSVFNSTTNSKSKSNNYRNRSNNQNNYKNTSQERNTNNNNNRNASRKIEEYSKDSNDVIQNNNEDDDDFITVEKKSKNIYKPKKTPALAVEGSKIYSNISNSSNKSNHSRRN